MIQLPLLGPVAARGLTPLELATQIESLFDAQYLVNPSVTIAVAQTALQRVTLAGAVNKPGVYEWTGRLSLIDAVAMGARPRQYCQI